MNAAGKKGEKCRPAHSILPGHLRHFSLSRVHLRLRLPAFICVFRGNSANADHPSTISGSLRTGKFTEFAMKQ
jgi:hypothetical protein